MSIIKTRNAQSQIVPLNSAGAKKLMVLHTSVLEHDPQSVFGFADNDVYLVGSVNVRLDSHCKGQSEVARNARWVSRLRDEIFRGDRNLMMHGASLAEISGGSATGKLFVQMESLDFDLPNNLIDDRADRDIIAAACALRVNRKHYSRIVLVSKDSNVRFAALRADSAIEVEDYLNDRVSLRDSDVLPTGFHVVPDFFDTHDTLSSGKRGTHNFWQVRGNLCRDLMLNECLFIGEGDSAVTVQVKACSDNEATLQEITNYEHSRNAVWGIRARNREQSIALSHLMNPEIDLVMLLGDAGTGKSLCALAAGLTLSDQKISGVEGQGIDKILITRAMVPVGGEEMGFLPGGVEEKFAPWMLAFEDSMAVLSPNPKKAKKPGKGRTEDSQKRKEDPHKRIEMQPIGLVAGRTLINRFVIVDEAQNLTRIQAERLVTRVGDGTKIVVCGNLSQIDTPELNERSSGLAHLVMRMRGERGHPRVAHVILRECVRSPLARHAVESFR